MKVAFKIITSLTMLAGCSHQSSLIDEPELSVTSVNHSNIAKKNDIETIGNSLGMRFALIQPGEFVMGVPDSKKGLPIPPGFIPHKVLISKPYFLSTCEVTQGQYEELMGINPSWHTRDKKYIETANDFKQFPVENVTWIDAMEFCKQLTELPGEKEAGRTYRLPSEAEWEFACRERASLAYEFQPSKAKITGENAGIPSGENALPIKRVRSYPPNSLGLYDMRGNVWEWTADWFSPSYYSYSPYKDPQGPASGMLKVVRGSDWIFVGPKCNYPRDPLEPWQKGRFIGFRVICVLSDPLL